MQIIVRYIFVMIIFLLPEEVFARANILDDCKYKEINMSINGVERVYISKEICRSWRGGGEYEESSVFFQSKHNVPVNVFDFIGSVDSVSISRWTLGSIVFSVARDTRVYNKIQRIEGYDIVVIGL